MTLIIFRYTNSNSRSIGKIRYSLESSAPVMLLDKQDFRFAASTNRILLLACAPAGRETCTHEETLEQSRSTKCEVYSLLITGGLNAPSLSNHVASIPHRTFSHSFDFIIFFISFLFFFFFFSFLFFFFLFSSFRSIDFLLLPRLGSILLEMARSFEIINVLASRSFHLRVLRIFQTIIRIV